jgi:PPP family 3-phenylpropionic acid transporter
MMADPAPQPVEFVKPWRFEMRSALLYAAIFIAPGFHLPYFPLWLQENGFDANQIAIALSAPLFLRLFTTPMITAFADRTAERANVLVAVVGISALLSLGYLLPPTFVFVLALSVVIQIFWTPHAPLIDSIVLSGVRRFGVDYPSVRKWGSASFLCANFGGGLIVGMWGINAVPVIIAIGLFIALFVCMTAPRLGRPRRASPLSAAAMLETPGLLTRPFVLVVAAAGIINSSHGLLFSFGSIYWRDIGIDERLIGFLFAFMVVAEIALMMVFTRFFGRLSAPRLLTIAGSAAVIRWLMFPLVEPLGLGAPGFLFTQSLHALSTGFLLIGVPKMLAETVGEERMGAAQGAAFFANGLSMGLVTMVSGAIYSGLGATGFYIMAAIAAAGMSLLLFITPTARAAAATPPSRDS